MIGLMAAISSSGELLRTLDAVDELAIQLARSAERASACVGCAPRSRSIAARAGSTSVSGSSSRR
jgi:hypothetical protein